MSVNGIDQMLGELRAMSAKAAGSVVAPAPKEAGSVDFASMLKSSNTLSLTSLSSMLEVVLSCCLFSDSNRRKLPNPTRLRLMRLDFDCSTLIFSWGLVMNKSYCLQVSTLNFSMT